ncbi:MAG: 23S rRNA (guanosine(2251)-2'-O)-methyltransferase RlmB [Hyphomicrobiales bacterium]|nr:23S rRNA (guanosine(2251)-2'-O)-methyltransferase RlmB [Hyphomicrobiales bacterium]
MAPPPVNPPAQLRAQHPRDTDRKRTGQGLMRQNGNDRRGGDRARRRHGGERPEASARSPDFRKPGHDVVAIYGLHAVREALVARRRKALTLYATAAAAERLGAAAGAAGAAIVVVEAADLDRRLGQSAVHQGVLLEARPLPQIDLSEIKLSSGVVLALDQITDPHNVGAILRTAAAFAVDALIVTERHAPDFSGVLAKTASGGLEHVPLAPVVNLARALDELGDLGYWRVGLDSEGAQSLEEMDLPRPLVLVLGAEGAGLRRLTRERCDVMARLDMPGPVKSLNVSNACAVALAYANLRRS